jgi:hypothetical protein
MQLSKLLILVLILPFALCAQDGQDGWFKTNAFTETEINFMNSYYQQDGNNSPVTGGMGTEQLTDITPTIIVTVPIDSANAVTVNVGADFYTSASTDNIDTRTGASGKDLRSHVDINYQRLLRKVKGTVGLSGGISAEYDVFSFNAGLNFSKEFSRGNQFWSISANTYQDSWTTYIPVELRGRVDFSSKQRSSYNFSSSFSQVINKRMQVLFTAGLTYQSGLLSTPFHRVFFNNSTNVSQFSEYDLIRSDIARDVERLPSSRLKIPLGVRFNYYLSDLINLRTFYRYYRDDFGLTANTFQLEAPIKINPFFSIIPSYRVHDQQASKYFLPFGEHAQASEFYTSDYDLSSFNAHQIGIAIRYSPVAGIGRAKIGKRLWVLEGLDAKYATYNRSDGLNASIVSLDLSFKVKKSK